MKHIAVFGDCHGHLRLLLQLCRLWQLQHSVKLDGVLQCGDLGFFPDSGILDKATLRFARRDPEELGFSRFFRCPEPLEKDELVSGILSGSYGDLSTLSCRVNWCHGNHEDFRELERIGGKKRSVSVDCYGAFELLPDGCVYDVAGVQVAALGGGPEQPGMDSADFSLPDPWKWVSQRACYQLLGQSFNVLLTHCAPSHSPHGGLSLGSEMIRLVVEECKPLYHFYAHHSAAIPPVSIGNTKCYWLNDVNFERSARKVKPFGRLNPGCMGLLRWNNADDHHFAVLDEPWIKGVNGSNWRYL